LKVDLIIECVKHCLCHFKSGDNTILFGNNLTNQSGVRWHDAVGSSVTTLDVFVESASDGVGNVRRQCNSHADVSVSCNMKRIRCKGGGSQLRSSKQCRRPH